MVLMYILVFSILVINTCYIQQYTLADNISNYKITYIDVLKSVSR